MTSKTQIMPRQILHEKKATCKKTALNLNKTKLNMYPLSLVLLLFPLVFIRFVGEFLVLNLDSTEDVILNASSWYFQGLF